MKKILLLIALCFLLISCSSQPQFIYIDNPQDYCVVADELIQGHNTSTFTEQDWESYAADVTGVYLARAQNE